MKKVIKISRICRENLVGKHAQKYNKYMVHTDVKKKVKAGYSKHKRLEW